MKKVLKAIREVYKVALKDNIKIEYVREDDDIEIWSCDNKEEVGELLWVVLCQDTQHIVLHGGKC